MVRKIIGHCYIYLILLLMYIPVLVLIAFSFTTAGNVGEWTGFSFDLYPRLFQNEEIMIALGNTLILAVTSALVSVILGTTGAIGSYIDLDFTSRLWNEGSFMAVIMLIIIGISMFLTRGQEKDTGRTNLW